MSDKKNSTNGIIWAQIQYLDMGNKEIKMSKD